MYRNLKNLDLITPEKAIALSSLVTKILISCSKIDDINDRLLFANAMNIEKLNQALTDYALYDQEDELLECYKEVNELLNLLYKD